MSHLINLMNPAAFSLTTCATLILIDDDSQSCLSVIFPFPFPCYCCSILKTWETEETVKRSLLGH